VRRRILVRRRIHVLGCIQGKGKERIHTKLCKHSVPLHSEELYVRHPSGPNPPKGYHRGGVGWRGVWGLEGVAHIQFRGLTAAVRAEWRRIPGMNTGYEYRVLLRVPALLLRQQALN
jgi:hypothetical protein